MLVQQIQNATQHCRLPCFAGHSRMHSNIPSPLAECPAAVDNLTKTIAVSLVELAQESHDLHHQNSINLRKQFRLTREAVCQIIKQCDMCSQYLPVHHLEVNHCGLLPNHSRQMVVTNIAEFGKLRDVHVIIDTYSYS